MEKLFVGCCLIFSLAGLAQNDDPSLLFRVNFDNYSVIANKAAGDPNSSNFRDSLALRMYPGVSGKGNAMIMNTSESVQYSAFKNFNPKQGTVSFWISSQKWDYRKKRLHSFFQTAFSKYVFEIYEEHCYSDFRFVISTDGAKEVGSVTVPMKKDVWTKGRWHKIDAVWNANMMALFIDGGHAKQQEWTKNPFKFNAPINWPETATGRYMRLGWGTNGKMEDMTAYDELEIYDRVLSPAEIKLNYEKLVPLSNFDKKNPILTVPQGKMVTVDGLLNPAEWGDVACFILRNPEEGASVKSLSAKVYIKNDAENLMLGAEIVGGEKADITGDDIVDIWRDDAFEFHIMTAKNKRYQFILNSHGAMFDATVDRNDGIYDLHKLNSKWASGSRCAAKRSNGKWCLELVIPRKNIGADSDSLSVNFCATRYLEKPEHVCWGMNCKSFYDETKFGILKFHKTEKPVRMEACHFENGEFELKLSSEVEARLVTADGRIMPRPDGDTWKVELPEGIYDFTANANGFYYASRIIVSKPFEIEYTCYASKHRLDVALDLSRAGKEIRNSIENGTANAEIAMIGHDQSVMASKKSKLTGIKDTFSLTIPEEPKQGVYQVKAIITDKEKKLLQAQKRFRVPDMTPYRYPVAKDHSVPQPWTPVNQVGPKEFEVWNRIYTFENGPFPIQVKAEGKNMLRNPPELYLDETPVLWNGFMISEKFDDEICFSGTGSAKGLEFNWTSTLCFDGLVKIKIRMVPENDTVMINDLKLRWSVPAEFARAMLEPLYSPWRNQYRQVYRFPYAHGGDFMIWTVGVKHGFLWWPESSANWKHPDGHKQFSLSREGDTVKINADFIVDNAELEQEAVYTMVFMATPSRPEPPKRRDCNPGHIWGYLKHESFKVQYYMPHQKPLACSTEPWTGLIAYDPVKYQKNIDEIESKGSRYMPYSQPMMIDILDENYDYFFPEWEQIPGYSCGAGVSYKTGEHYVPESCCGHTGAEDLYVWRADKHLADFPKVAGIYYDCATGRLCANRLHGCGGTDAFGKTYSSSGLLRHRDYYIRLKRVLKKHGDDKILYLHAHHRFSPFTHGIADYYITGEQFFTSLLTNLEHFYCEDIPLEEYQSAYYTPIKGTGFLFESSYEYLTSSGQTKENCRLPVYTLKVLTPCLLHDLNLSNAWLNTNIMEHWWKLKNDIRLSDAEFHGYWFSDAVRSGSDKVYVSWYEWEKPSPFARMLVVGNVGRTDQPTALKIDLKKLDLEGKNLKYTDIWTGKDVLPLGTLQVENNNFLLIGITIK